MPPSEAKRTRYPGESPRPVQTHLTEEARAAIQVLADRESNGSVALYLRSLLMRELWEHRRSLRNKGVPILPNSQEEVSKKIRIDLTPEFREDTLASIELLATLSGQSHAGWLKGVILRELHRKRRTLAAAKKTQGT